jgi:hypothetical protein
VIYNAEGDLIKNSHILLWINFLRFTNKFKGGHELIFKLINI